MSSRNRSLTFLACPLLLLGCHDGPTRIEQLEFAEVIDRIEVDAGSGEIVVVAEADRDHVDIEAVIRGNTTKLRWRLEGQTLHLAHECAPGSWTCTVDWYVWVPQQGAEYLSLDLESGSGDIIVDHVRGNVWASTGSGDLQLQDMVGLVIELETGSGDLLVVNTEADSIEASTGSGDAELTLTGAPRRIALETGSGDVRLTVPGDGYQLDLDAGSGTIDVHGITHEPGGGSLISISTGSGDIAVFGG